MALQIGTQVLISPRYTNDVYRGTLAEVRGVTAGHVVVRAYDETLLVIGLRREMIKVLGEAGPMPTGLDLRLQQLTALGETPAAMAALTARGVPRWQAEIWVQAYARWLMQRCVRGQALADLPPPAPDGPAPLVRRRLRLA
jgi:hypothetical protein